MTANFAALAALTALSVFSEVNGDPPTLSLDQYSDRELFAESATTSHLIEDIHLFNPKLSSSSIRSKNDESIASCSLHKLPLELIHQILCHLDLLSLSRLAKTSYAAYLWVEQYSPYETLKSEASIALSALQRSGTTGHHSAQMLYDALHSKHCASCNAFGAYLSLATGQRCCEYCLENNAAFWMISHRQACQIFDLDDSDLKSLPEARVAGKIPGMLIPRWSWQGYRLAAGSKAISVKKCKEIALGIHGALDPDAPPRKKPTVKTVENKLIQARVRARLRDTPLHGIQPLHINMATWDGISRNFVEGGFAPAVLFPYRASQGDVEWGYRCKGCKYIYDRLCVGAPFIHVPPPVLRLLNPNRLAKYQLYLVGIDRIVRSRASFLAHVRKCWGVQLLLDNQT